MIRPLEMKINLSALEHLGINLYSTVPAVLSEIVANAWDADAALVNVNINNLTKKITIQDNGIGMTRDEVIDRFLTVGFRRRAVNGSVTPIHGRKPMGRKGIGKLSSFAIANVVEVFTVRNAEKTAFCIDVEKIKAAFDSKDKNSYCPVELGDWPEDLTSGTRIVLRNLKRTTNQSTHQGLRQRLSRRFSVIDPKHDFCVRVNGCAIGPNDRGYHKHVEYLWVYGNMSNILPHFTGLAPERSAEERSSAIEELLQNAGITVTGWIGTVKHPGVLKEDKDENLNRIAMFMRGKLAQEDILSGFAQKEIYASYVVGEIYCDELDHDDEEDIATSSRQSLKYDDPRFEAIREIILHELRYIARCWTEWRREDGTRVLSGKVPEVADWLNTLQRGTRAKAEKWIGRLNVIRASGDKEKRELLKASILAFESYRRKEDLDFLENLTDENIEPVLSVFNDIDDLERSYYGQIVKLRLGVIKTLEEKLCADSKERVIQNHIYNHLWLIDPSWERAKGSEVMETSVEKYLKESSGKLSTEERKARIDIGYRTASGRHVIVELKRASVSTPVDVLAAQIRKYRSGAQELIAKSSYPKWPLDIICLVGQPPDEWNTESGQMDVKRTLASVDARLVFYDQLLDNSYRAYSDYLEEHKKLDPLWNIFHAIDDFTVSNSFE